MIMSLALPREWFGSSIRNDGLRREKARIRVGAIAAYLLAVAIPVAVLLFYILQGVEVIRTGYDIDELRQSLQSLQTEQDRLEVELASLQTLESLEKLAVRDLGMIHPPPGHVVTVQRGPGEVPATAAKESGAPGGVPGDNRLLAFLRSITKAL